MSEKHRSASRSKPLSKLDLELWSAVTADVRPFRSRPIQPAPPEAAPANIEARPASTLVAHRDAPPAARASAPPISDIDQRTRKKLRRGRLDVDAKLDLHGMRQSEAHHALIQFLRHAQADGAKVAIVVTGKGQSSDTGGVLRRMAPLWLQSPTLRDVVVGFGEASRNHGGEGALYVRIRRADRVTKG
ncbi:MAG: Smr/MutS family protein [Methylocystis sp.]|jgi:DNA-nicking Smr family endonuclease